VRELDFLPEWYKQGRRRQSHMRKQYIALVLIFLAMVSFNLTATYRASKAAAELTRREEQRMRAENITREFDRVAKQINTLKVQADLMARIDAKVDVAAILAEMSHLIGESIVLHKVGLVAEPCARATPKDQTKSSAVRAAGGTAGSAKRATLGNNKFRITMAGVAVQPSHVADLVCRLDESSYFQQVSLSFSRSAKMLPPAAGATDRSARPGPHSLEVTEFEIACYLANYEEIGK
jgi:hypothetical protein